MKQIFVINAVIRDDMGKGASRRLRREDKVPGIVYGAGKKPQSIAVEHKLLSQHLAKEAFYTQLLELEIAGNKEHVILRDLQRHPFKPRVLHLDLQRVSATEKITMRIPLHFIGADVAPGVKVSGGLISHLMSDVEIHCLPKDLPEFIEVDLSNLELNQTVHLSDLKVPAEVEVISLAHDEDKPVATAYIPRAVVEEETAPVAAAVPVAGEEAAVGGEAASEDSNKGKEQPDKKGK